MIGPPQNAQITVPGFTYPFVIRSMITISRVQIITWMVPTVTPAVRAMPCTMTVKGSEPRSVSKKRLTPRWATVSPRKSTINASHQPKRLRPDVSFEN